MNTFWKALLERATKNPKTTAAAVVGLVTLLTGYTIDNETVEIIGGVIAAGGAVAGKD